MAEKNKAGLWRYLKEAFKFRWNLLIFGGASAAALLSGHGDILLPLVGAVELTYLAGLTSLPRFQAAIDAKVVQENNPNLLPGQPSPDQTRRKLADVLSHLNHHARARFQELHRRCQEMRRIADGVTGGAPSGGPDLRAPALDRLLWVFLRLLFSHQALQRFLQTTSEDAINRQLTDLEAKRKAAEGRADERILKSLIDSITTAEIRLENYRKAQSNAEFVTVELDRIEGKIQALTEMAVSSQDPDYISNQVDAVADGMAQTEETIKELQLITGMSDEMEGPPPILETDLTEVIEA
jgi:DNA-binding FrmR family transcriptional regulator